MKNKIIIIFLISIFYLNSLSIANGDEFTFRVTDLEILENNTVYKGNSRGKVITETQVELESDNFVYLKKINRLEANGNVELTDIKNNVIINAEKMVYLKSEEIIYTVGKTLINIDNQYNIEGYNFTFLKNKMILSSNEKATITDINSNVYKLSQFQYLINEEILKGEKIFYRRNEIENKEDEYYFENGFFNLKKNEFLGKDISMKFHKTLFDDEKNDPRVNAAIGYGDQYNTYLEKGVFTSCKKTDKCPPWKMRAKKIQHDKIKKQIIYKNAWLELYDLPIVYFPKFFHPDPSVKRQSGLLRPAIGDHNTLGDSIYLPYFFVISDDKDITIKPRLFNNNVLVLQNEYRQITKNSISVIDSSITTGHNSSKLDKKDSRSHFFANSKIKLNFKEYINSNLEINFEKTSNDNYLKLFNFMKSPLLKSAGSNLESRIKLDLEHENYDFTSSIEMYETLSGSSSDRFQYVLPSYKFSKNFNIINLNGGFNFSSSGNNTISNTNVNISSISNDLNFSSYSHFLENGITTNFELFLKNINSIGKNTNTYKNSPQSEIMTAYGYNMSLPLSKKNEKSINTLIPKISFRASPHEMKNNSSSNRRINNDNIFSYNRLSLGDSFESGGSLTLGIDFIKEKTVTEEEIGFDDKILQLEEYFDFKLATVLNIKEEKKLPEKSTLNKKNSNIFGQLNFKPNKVLSLKHDFSLTNNLDVVEYNALSTIFNYENFTTEFKFIEERGVIGETDIIENFTKYNFNEYNSVSFATRKNRELNLTEYYDLVYEYKNDCLIADIKYRKDYYSDSDIIPKEELFFSITIVPFYTYSPDKMILNKDRID